MHALNPDPQAISASEVQVFFEAFVNAFALFDGHLIAKRYMAPYLSADAKGALRQFSSAGQIGEYFDGIVKGYRDQGCRSCRFTQLSVTPMGQNSTLASVSWELLTEDAQIISCWRESYNLTRTPDGLRIFASVDHAT